MREHLSLIIHLLFTLAKLCKPGGVKALMAEHIAMRQQLITLSRARKRAPKLRARAKINSHFQCTVSTRLECVVPLRERLMTSQGK